MTSLLPASAFLFVFLSLPSSLLAINIKEYGAVSDGKTDNTKALQRAWTTACAAEGGASVEIPKGSFLIGPVLFKGPCKSPKITINLQGNLVAKRNLKVYKKNWIEVQHINGLVMTGPGKVDGQGAIAWSNNKCRQNHKLDCKAFPMNMVFSFLENARISGITSLNSKYFHMMVFSCKNVTFDSISISAPGDSPNTDGIHIALSKNIVVQNSIIGTGDDCVSVGDNTVNLTVAGVTCGPGHGISIGSLGRNPREQDVVGITVRNCSFTGTQNGVRIKTWEDGPKNLQVRDLLFENITMTDVENPIVIDQKYCPSKTCPGNSKPSRVKISNVQFNDITGTSAEQTAINIVCSASFPCSGVQLKNVDLKYNGAGEAEATCVNAKTKIVGTVNPSKCAEK